MSPREAANIHPEKHNILVFLSNTLFPPFYVPSPSLFPISKNGRYLGGTWEELGRNMGGTFSFYLRYLFAFQSIPKRSSIEDKAKFYRRPIEHLSKTYRTSIEDLSNIYRTSIEDLSKKGWRGSGEGAEREQRKNLATKLQNSEVSFSPFWSLVSLNGTFWHFLALFGR